MDQIPSICLPYPTTEGVSYQGKTRPITVASLLADADRTPIRRAYVHIPFCFHKCHYCDFFSIVDRRDRQPAYTKRLISEIESWSGQLDRPLKSLFFGGGTPTLLAIPLWKTLLEALNRSWKWDGDTEITVEANPETVTAELLTLLAAGGINRISIGAQSFNTAHLKTLERWHDPARVSEAIAYSRAAGIKNISLDLIFAIPGQTNEDWQQDLEQAIALQPDHLSCYGLTYEDNTPMTSRMKAGHFEKVSQETEAAMYQWTSDRLAEAGYEQYEISNWALPEKRCSHNLGYWANENWAALGPSASGHIDGLRWKQTPRLTDYFEHDGHAPVESWERVDADTQVGERFMLGLRLNEGLADATVDELLSTGTRGKERRNAIEKAIAGNLLEQINGSLRFTAQGRLLADSVLVDLL